MEQKKIPVQFFLTTEERLRQLKEQVETSSEKLVVIENSIQNFDPEGIIKMD